MSISAIIMMTLSLLLTLGGIAICTVLTFRKKDSAASKGNQAVSGESRHE